MVCLCACACVCLLWLSPLSPFIFLLLLLLFLIVCMHCCACMYVCACVVYCVYRSLFFPFIIRLSLPRFPLSHPPNVFISFISFISHPFRYTHISFSNRKTLWEGFTIIERLASISNKTDDDDRSSPHIPPSMAAIQTWQRVIVALLKPGSDFGYVSNAGKQTHIQLCVCVCARATPATPVHLTSNNHTTHTPPHNTLTLLLYHCYYINATLPHCYDNTRSARCRLAKYEHSRPPLSFPARVGGI